MLSRACALVCAVLLFGVVGSPVPSQDQMQPCKPPPKWTIGGRNIMRGLKGNVTLVALLQASWPFCLSQALRWAHIFREHIDQVIFGGRVTFFLRLQDADASGLLRDAWDAKHELHNCEHPQRHVAEANHWPHVKGQLHPGLPRNWGWAGLVHSRRRQGRHVYLRHVCIAPPSLRLSPCKVASSLYREVVLADVED